MILTICMKFQEDIFNGFSCQAQTRFCHRTASYKVQRGITKKQIHIQGLWLLCSTRRLMMLNTCMKFYEHISNGFKVIKRT